MPEELRGWSRTRPIRVAFIVEDDKYSKVVLDAIFEASTLDDCLIEMRGRQLLFQGHSWTCPKCHHRNWIDLEELSPTLSCEVCQKAADAPVAVPWRFRANEFLVDSLRDHSVLSLVWVLSALRSRARRSLIFVEPTWFFFDSDPNKRDDPDAEADLLVLLDGKAILCEAKSSWRSLRPSHVSDFAELASRLRPDCALLAVMENGGPGPAGEIEAARRRLAYEKIDFELLTLNEFKPGDDPYLS